MERAPASRQHNLLLPLQKADAVGGGYPGMAVRTGGAGDVLVATFVRRGNRRAASVALLVTAPVQPLVHGDPVVEHEALPAPSRFGFGHGRKVIQYPALQVEHLFKPPLLQIGRGLFATDAAGAVHRNLFCAYDGPGAGRRNREIPENWWCRDLPRP